MSTYSTDDWIEANKKYLKEALVPVREALEIHALPASRGADTISIPPLKSGAIQNRIKQYAEEMTAPPALDTLCEAFGLSPFEREVLLLCAGMELDSAFATLCATAQGDPLRAYPTFSLALAALPEPHWSALNPGAPLRHWRLIEVGAGSALTISPLRIDERILHYLTGVRYLDEQLAGLVEPLQASCALVPSQRMLAEGLAMTWSSTRETSALPAIQLCGSEFLAKKTIAASACASLGLNLYMISAGAIPQNPTELEALVRLWSREAILSSSALLVDCDEADTTDATRDRAITQLIEHTGGALIVTTRLRRRSLQRPMVTFDVNKPTPDEQRMIWKSMGKSSFSLNGGVERVVSQFNLSTEAIHNACNEFLGSLVSGDGESSADEPVNKLWDICRAQTRPHLDDMAHRIDTQATWDDLVIPSQQQHILREIAIHVRQRFKVYENWGFASKGSRGLGISALFAGASGTGKTLAAEVLANELHLDLYRIDLSQVVSKYIGETEKNLMRVFDAAEDGGTVLLFDEADALFGKRGEVKDSHDRYANIEISYLLQRMEAYRGLAILTTNMKSALDSAFLRRIRFVVQFPFPDTAQRAEIWRRIFPENTPTNGVNFEKLARLNVAGGNIRNIALNAAFLAAEADEPVGMKHLLHASRSEYVKLEKPLTEAEIGGWV
jgi:hypothetical protein